MEAAHRADNIVLRKYPAHRNAAKGGGSVAKPQVKVISSELVYQGKVFGVRHDTVIEPNGVHATRDVVTHNGSVVLLPVTTYGSILLVTQYRYTAREFMWELPAGRIEPGEKPLVAAQRELSEETGYKARRFRLMMDVYPTPGFVQERMYMYAATKLYVGASTPDEDEQIEVKPFTMSELLQMIRDREIYDAKTVAGVLFHAQFPRG
jgi:ADP-ribose pyrophosphatase